MTDKLIAERLREAAEYEFQTDHPQRTVLVEPTLLREAADALEQAEDALEDTAVSASGYRADRDRLQAENERLREAVAEALTSLATGPAKDGYAYSLLDAVLSERKQG